MKNRSRLLETTRGALVGLCLCLVLAACGGTSSLAGTKANETTTTSTTTTTTLGLPQPTASKPITILDVGDSLGEDLGLGLGYTLGNNPLVRVVQAARGDTGLARPDYYNWPAHFAALLNEYHPQVVTILIGGNDSQSFDADNQVVVFGTSLWRTIYTERVELMMHEAQEGAGTTAMGGPADHAEPRLRSLDADLERDLQSPGGTTPRRRVHVDVGPFLQC